MDSNKTIDNSSFLNASSLNSSLLSAISLNSPLHNASSFSRSLFNWSPLDLSSLGSSSLSSSSLGSSSLNSSSINSSSFNSTSLTTHPILYDSTHLGYLYLFPAILVMVSNLIVVLVVIKSKELHLPTMWNIAFMSVCDFIYGLHYAVFLAPSAFLKRFVYAEALVGPASCLLSLLYGQNVLNILVAAIERYLSICWPLKHTRLMSANRFIFANFITFTISVVRVCLVVLPDFDVYYNPFVALTTPRFYSVIGVAASTGLPFVTLLAILGVILRIGFELRLSKRRVHPQVPTLYQDKHSRSLTITIVLSAVLFCLNNVPTCMAVIWNLMYGFHSVHLLFLQFSIVCVLSNSLWNVVIYAMVFRPFRMAFLRFLFPKYYRRKLQEEAQVVG